MGSIFASPAHLKFSSKLKISPCDIFPRMDLEHATVQRLQRRRRAEEEIEWEELLEDVVAVWLDGGDGFSRFMADFAGVLFAPLGLFLVDAPQALIDDSPGEPTASATTSSPFESNLSKADSTLYPLLRNATDISASVCFMPMALTKDRRVASCCRNDDDDDDAPRLLLGVPLGAMVK